MAESDRPVIIVTGASRGIGLAVAQILTQNFNANVVALSRSEPSDSTDLTSSGKLTFIKCDVSDDIAVKDAVESTLRKFNRIDGLVLNAGTLDPLTRIDSKETTTDQWRKHFDVNFFTLVTTLQESLPSLRESKNGGKVVFVSSGAAVKGMPGWGPYSAGKAAMNSLCRTLASEEKNLVVIAVRPGIVDTNMQATLREQGAPHMGEAHQMFLDLHSEGNLLKAEDPGHVIASLSINAKKDLSGEFLSWDSQELAEYRKKNDGC